jgi:ribosomal protein S18 acetylase RimI-like enzyme
MSDLRVAALAAATWPDFAALVERDGGVWGGCWCLGFHAEGKDRGAFRRAAKERRVRAGGAHAALVYDAAGCVGWCQYGAPAELPRIKHARAYAAGDPQRPDWRITCFYVGKGHRRRGVSATALAGALDLIAAAGGGRVESFPEDVAGRKVSGSFLHNGTLALFERHGFERVRPLGRHHWLVARDV